MKKEDLSVAIGNIDQKIIESSLAFKVDYKGRFIKILSLAACLAIIVTAIPVSMLLSKKDNNVPSDVTTPDKVEIEDPVKDDTTEKKPKNVIYCNSDLEISEDLIQQAFKGEEVEVVTERFYHYFDHPVFSKNGLEKILEPDVNVPSELKFAVGGQEIYAVLDLVYLTNDAVFYGTEFAKENGKIARYTIKTIDGEEPLLCDMRGPEYNWRYGSDENRKIDLKVYYRIATKEIINIDYLFRVRAQHLVDPEADIEISESELLAIAEKDLLTLYGEEVVSSFSATISSAFEKVPYKGGFWQHQVEFQRHFEGCGSNETITLVYDDLGRLCFASTNALHSQENATEEAIEYAKERAAILLNGKLLTGRYDLCTSANGSIFLKCFYYTGLVNSNGTPDTSLMWVKVNTD